MVKNPLTSVGAMAQVQDTQEHAAVREGLINDPEFLKVIVESAVQRVLEWEMTEHLQASPHERTDVH